MVAAAALPAAGVPEAARSGRVPGPEERAAAQQAAQQPRDVAAQVELPPQQPPGASRASEEAAPEA